MGIVNAYVAICFIVILIYECYSRNLVRTRCLETAVRFMNDPDRCHFDLRHAKDVLQDESTCPNQCEVKMNDLETRKTYMLHQVVIHIGRVFKKSPMCVSYKWGYSITNMYIDMYINCSSWDKDYYSVYNSWDSYMYRCSVIGAQCDRLSDDYCVCHCYAGYIMVKENCLKGNIAVSDSCVHDRQCTGTAYANSCRSWKCTCQTGYMLIGNNCFKENVTVDKACTYDWQCTGTKFAGLCRSSVCSCQAGYALIDNSCYQGNITVGDSCSYDSQCAGTQFSGSCSSGVCTCQAGYNLIDNNCYLGNLSFYQLCVTNNQCSASDDNGYHSRQQQDQKIATILGTLFGGVLLGAIITTVITKRARNKSSPNRREQSIEMFASNDMYGSPWAVARASSQNN